MENSPSHTQTGITIGKVIAGAAVASGAVLLTVAGLDAMDVSIGEIPGAIGNALVTTKDQILGLFVSQGGSATGATLDTASKYALAGTAALGGGLLYKQHLNAKAEELQTAYAPVNHGFEDRLQCSRLGDMTKLQMATNSPEFMAQFGQGQRR